MTIYTDGAYSSSKKLGAFGIYIPETDYKFFQVVSNITSQEAELLAFIYAIRYAMLTFPNQQITIVSDSIYCVQGFVKWMHTWNIPARKNSQYWTVLFDLWNKGGKNFTIRHCRGHGKGKDTSPEDLHGNDVIDKLVAKAVQMQ